jgi:hypothetical protein
MLFCVARQRSARQAAGVATTAFPLAAAGKQRDDVTQQYWNTVSMQHAGVTSHASPSNAINSRFSENPTGQQEALFAGPIGGS